MNTEVADLSTVFIDFRNIPFQTILFFLVAALILILAIQRGLPRLSEKLPSRFRRVILPSIPVLRLAVIILAIVEIVPLIVKPTPQNLLAILGSVAVAVRVCDKRQSYSPGLFRCMKNPTVLATGSA